MRVFISDKDTVKLCVEIFRPKYPQIDIDARMSWSMAEILKSFKKLAVVYYQV